MIKGWLQFFRIVNLPTVPGDVLVGASALVFGAVAARRTVVYDISAGFRLSLWAALASVFLYLFGLADNDLVGAKDDGPDRPIPRGELSRGAARLARGICLFLALVVGAVADLPPAWWIVAFALSCAVVLYNRTKRSVLMGLCRGLNVVCGGAALLTAGLTGLTGFASVPVCAAAAVWTLYIACVTKYSSDEGGDPAKRRRVGFLIGAIVYLQLAALLLIYLATPSVWSRNLLLVGAGLLVLLRLMKRLFPKVSAS